MLRRVLTVWVDQLSDENEEELRNLSYRDLLDCGTIVVDEIELVLTEADACCEPVADATGSSGEGPDEG